MWNDPFQPCASTRQWFDADERRFGKLMGSEESELAAIGADVHNGCKVASERDRLMLNRGSDPIAQSATIVRLTNNPRELTHSTEV